MHRRIQTVNPDYLRGLIAARGWSVHRLAQELGVAHPVLFRYLAREIDLSDNLRRKLARIFPEVKSVFLVRVISEETEEEACA